MPITLDTLSAKLDEILQILKAPAVTPPPGEDQTEVRVNAGIALVPGEGTAVRTDTAPWFYDGQHLTFRCTVNAPHVITACQWTIPPLMLGQGAEQSIVAQTTVFGSGERDSICEAIVSGKAYRIPVRWGLIGIPIANAPWYKPPVVVPPPTPVPPTNNATTGDPESDTWAPPTLAEYTAGGKLRLATSPDDYAAIIPLARVGRCPKGEVAASFENLLWAYAEIDKLIHKEKTYFADGCKIPPSWSCQQALVILGPSFGFDYKAPFGVLGTGPRVDDFDGYRLSDLCQRFFVSGGGPGQG